MKMMRDIYWTLILCTSFSWGTTNFEDANQCFCELQGRIDDCSCTVDTVDHFNNMKIFPRLQSLLNKDYFRYFRYNAKKPCPFWDPHSAKCASQNCGVSHCSMEDLPKGIVDEDSGEIHDVEHEKKKYTDPSCGEEDFVDSTISDKARNDLAAWKAHDDSVINFCDIDEEYCPECDYVDLTLNPERYTGYSGEASAKIWRAIYEENCFKPENVDFSQGFGAAFIQDSIEKGMCLEKRAFYKALSGLHASITIHLCANYLLSKNLNDPLTKKSTWGPNLHEFIERFDPQRTHKQGPYWLKNLYFVYLLELRALTKGSFYFEKQIFYTGNDNEDKDTQIAVKEIMNLLRSFPSETFDESMMFANEGMESLKLEFRNHFHNITRIMDCVTCDKCKLWGKLQTTGLGTALKILFSDIQNPDFYLSRNEVVALFNAFGRISTSIQQVENFRQMMKKK